MTSESKAPYVHFGLNKEKGASSAGVHTVESGDTLWTLSKRYKLSMQDLIYVNELSPPYALNVTDRLNLPPPNRYNVRPGDSLYIISQTFDVSMSELARQNDLKAPFTIHSGDVLRVPSVRPNSVTPGAKPGQAQSGDDHNIVVRRKPNISKSTQEKVRRIATKNVPKRASSKFLKPVQGDVISGYGPKKGGLHNNGINIKAPRGAPVRAAENGVVVYADNQLEGYGNLVLVRHDDRWMTAYAHLDKTLIKKGQTIMRGETLGTVGSSGSVQSPQLHFELRRGTEAINPKIYLGQSG
jgi:murein DD-endopeptidase MepM/ murein hydrolase activator NlpD